MACCAVAGDYRDELERWKQEALSVLQGMVGKKKWNDVEQHVRAGKATMDVVKRAIADGKIAPLPKQGVKVSDEELRALHNKRIVYFEKRKGEVLDLLEGVMGVRSVDESKLSSCVYFNTPYGKVRLSDHAEPMGTGHAVSTVLDLRYDMSDAEVLDAAEGLKNAQGGTLSWSVTGSRIPLAENQVKVKNKIIVTFKDGVKRSRKAHVTRSNGSEIWAVMPEIEELKKIGFPGGNVYLEVGDNKNGLLHLLSGHAAEILSLYPGVSLMAGLEMFVDEAFSSIAKLRGSYVGKGKKKDLNIESTAYDSGERRKKKRVSLSFHKTPDEHYTISTVFEPDANKPFPRIKEEKDGLTCTVTVELDGKAPGLPTSFIHKPSDAWPRHARRPSENKYITPNSNVKGEDIAVWRDIKHPDVEAGARTRGNGNFSASLTGGNLAAVHTLSAENFLAAVELGGMPMPSVAVTRLDKPYEWGGAGYINLIGKPDMVDPRKGADVYSADAYVRIVVAEEDNGDKFYDLDATDVEDVEANKGASATPEATRVPNAGRQGHDAPKGRIRRVKEYVNHIDAQNGNFSASLTGGKNLAAVHTLSAEKFLAAVELGGMPMPSVAVTRLDRPYEWGGAGAINLIGKPEMVDPRKGADVYGADAWASTMPLVERRLKKVKAREVTFDDLYALDKQHGTQTHGMRVCISWDYEGKRTMRQ